MEAQQEASSKTICKFGKQCKYVRLGECYYKHTNCKNGQNCTFLTTLSCGYLHSKEDYEKYKD